MDWGGEYETSTKSQASLIPGIVPAVGIMLIIIVGLFNALRPAAIIMLTIPFAVVGMTAGLLATGTPFGFVALLGAMALAGMMVKNAIVLLDEVNANLAAGKAPYDAVVEAALSRLRPVFLAAATTVLGVIPLLPDVFWVGLAVTIMAGLTIGTGFTMIVVPVLYATFYRISARQAASAGIARTEGSGADRGRLRPGHRLTGESDAAVSLAGIPATRGGRRLPVARRCRAGADPGQHAVGMAL